MHVSDLAEEGGSQKSSLLHQHKLSLPMQVGQKKDTIDQASAQDRESEVPRAEIGALGGMCVIIAAVFLVDFFLSIAYRRR